MKQGKTPWVRGSYWSGGEETVLIRRALEALRGRRGWCSGGCAPGAPSWLKCRRWDVGSWCSWRVPRVSVCMLIRGVCCDI